MTKGGKNNNKTPPYNRRTKSAKRQAIIFAFICKFYPQGQSLPLLLCVGLNIPTWGGGGGAEDAAQGQCWIWNNCKKAISNIQASLQQMSSHFDMHGKRTEKTQLSQLLEIN